MNILLSGFNMTLPSNFHKKRQTLNPRRAKRTTQTGKQEKGNAKEKEKMTRKRTIVELTD
jgi:hypothetical protein